MKPVWDQVGWQVWDQAVDQVYKQAEIQVRIQIKYEPVWWQVWCAVCWQTEDLVYDQTKSEGGKKYLTIWNTLAKLFKPMGKWFPVKL